MSSGTELTLKCPEVVSAEMDGRRREGRKLGAWGHGPCASLFGRLLQQDGRSSI